MANDATIIPFILSAEGGLSKAATDSASADPVPDGSGYHTNKGITWTTFKQYMSALGIPNITAAIQRFYAMSQSDWGYIFKAGYWDKIWGDQINSLGAAQVLVDWAWGAGPGAAVKALQKFLNTWLPANGKNISVTVDGGMGPQTLAALNTATAVNEKKFIADFSDYKKQWYLSLPNQSANYAGWTARLDALKAIALSNPVATGIIGTVVVLGSLLTFFFTERFI